MLGAAIRLVLLRRMPYANLIEDHAIVEDYICLFHNNGWVTWLGPYFCTVFVHSVMLGMMLVPRIHTGCLSSHWINSNPRTACAGVNSVCSKYLAGLCARSTSSVGGSPGGCLSTAVVGIHGHLASIIARIAKPVHDPLRFVCTLAH